jgi:hypothetical protein
VGDFVEVINKIFAEQQSKIVIELIKIKIYLPVRAASNEVKTDLCRGVNCLLETIQESIKCDSLSKIVFLFCNKDRKLLKVIWWQDRILD